MSQQKQLPKSINFTFGGLAGMGATAVVQPLDLLKNRLQMAGEGKNRKLYTSSLDAFVKIGRAEGVLGMWNGISAGLLRQATYTTTRLGIFSTLQDRYFAREGKNPNILIKGGMALIAGGIGAFVGTPADLTLIRMTSDGRLPEGLRRNYKNAIEGLVRISREEGVTKMWNGWRPTVIRAIVVNIAQLASYSQAKQFLLESKYFKDDILCHFAASLMSGFITTVASMPVDICKTRIQNQKPLPDGTLFYKNSFDVARKVIGKEGIFSLWKGFLPYFARIGPHTVITFILLEQMRKFYIRAFI
ncbi:Solute carrier family 25 member 11 [Oopsacas minuta]|uniref:Mitochondrial 2-oxoglutarate/malate carrier protein n=1 Tax=Oopsacas minuta TaxID=111878 RepID=A0AAV7JXV4_9METZ|nr:Solute carrier family 25 member 11 [Oopsacas minuta]